MRRGIDRLEKRNGPLGDSDSGSDIDEGSRRKGKGKAVETVHEAGEVLEPEVSKGGEGKRRRKASKKVCQTITIQ